MMFHALRTTASSRICLSNRLIRAKPLRMKAPMMTQNCRSEARE